MKRSRTARLDRMRGFRRRTIVAAALVAAAALSVVAYVAGLASTREPVAVVADTLRESPGTVAWTLSSAEASSGPHLLIEVPKVVGVPLHEAEFVLDSVGLRTRRSVPESVVGTLTIVEQSPPPGTKVERGSLVTLHVGAQRPRVAARERRPIVVIDPGHQSRADTRREPIGPGAAETKQRASRGATGRVTGTPEYALTLELSKRLARRLRASGVTVILTRNSSDVMLSNAQRAAIANRRRASLFVRVHADSASDRRLRGVATAFPPRNEWTARIEGESARAARHIHAALLDGTDAPDRGLEPRGDLSGFNWSKVPAVLVEAGLLSNADDDRLLATDAYQEKVAAGLAAGVLTYLEDDRPKSR